MKPSRKSPEQPAKSESTKLIEAEIIPEDEEISEHEKANNVDWKQDRWILLLVFILIFIAGYLVFPKSTQPVPGSYCTVQFRRELLGNGTNGPISPLSEKHNGSNLSIYGKLTSIDKQGIILQAEQYEDEKKTTREIWIPRTSILLIEQHKKKKSPE